MWEWLLEQATILVDRVATSTPKSEREDVVQEVMLHLIRYPQKAQKIYEKKEVRLLVTIIKETAYYHNVMDKEQCSKRLISYRQKIIDCCEKYGIEKNPKYAYKISPLLLGYHSIFTISFVENQLREINSKPVFVDIDDIGEIVDEKASNFVRNIK